MHSCFDCSDGSFGGKRGTECPPEWHAAGTDGSTGANSRTGTEHTGSSAVRTSAAREKVNMDDTKWADAIEELNDYIDQQIGGDKK